MAQPDRIEALMPQAMADLAKRRIILDFRRVTDDVACRACGYGIGIGDPAWFDDTGAVFCSEECANDGEDAFP